MRQDSSFDRPTCDDCIAYKKRLAWLLSEMRLRRAAGKRAMVEP
jgi:hypothetical protein